MLIRPRGNEKVTLPIQHDIVEGKTFFEARQEIVRRADALARIAVPVFGGTAERLAKRQPFPRWTSRTWTRTSARVCVDALEKLFHKLEFLVIAKGSRTRIGNAPQGVMKSTITLWSHFPRRAGPSCG
jgi:hypothetical protein